MKTPRNPAMTGTSRREFVAQAAAASATLAGAPLVRLAADSSAPASHGFRFHFVPCIHLRRDLRSPEGFANPLRAVGKLSPAPDFILTGGDMCHNLRGQTLEQSVGITDLFLGICQEHCSVPVHHCLGHQWIGPRMGTPEGFGVFDCGADGTMGFRYESHGWAA
jgi:3',5'-cyclic-AMP phosphodiesterase